MGNRPRRLDTIFQKYDSPVFFLTFGTHRRRRLLAHAAVHDVFLTFCTEAARRHIIVGRYVLMPDHIHLFVCGPQDFSLTDWVGALKRSLTKAIFAARPHWQPGFFDHLLRSGESYEEKWHYVRQNPERAGLCSRCG